MAKNNPIFKIVFKLLIKILKDSGLLSLAINELINTIISTIDKFMKENNLYEIPGVEENVKIIISEATNLNVMIAPVLPSLSDPKVLKYVKQLSNDRKQELLTKITSIENKLTSIIVKKNNFNQKINTVLIKTNQFISYVDQPLEVIGLSIPEIISIADGILTVLEVTPLPPNATALGSAVPGNKVLPKVRKQIDELGGILDFISSALNSLLKIVTTAKSYLNVLDSLLMPVINILSFIKTLLQLELDNVDPDNISQNQITLFNTAYDQTLSNFLANVSFEQSQFENLDSAPPNNNQTLDQNLNNRLSPNSQNPYIYKEFTFTIETNPSSSLPGFSSRRILATKPIDNTNINYIKLYNTLNRTYSFTTSTQTLVDEAKLQVDFYLNPSSPSSVFAGSSPQNNNFFPTESGNINPNPNPLSQPPDNVYPDFIPVNHYFIGGPTSTTVLGKTDPKSYKGLIPNLPQNTVAVDYSLLLSKNKKAVAKMELVPSSSNPGGAPIDRYSFVIYTGSFDERGNFINQPSYNTAEAYGFAYSLFVQFDSKRNELWKQLGDPQAYIKLEFIPTDFNSPIEKGTVRLLVGKMGTYETGIYGGGYPAQNLNLYASPLINNVTYNLRLYLNDYGRLSIQEYQTTGSISNWKDIYLINQL